MIVNWLQQHFIFWYLFSGAICNQWQLKSCCSIFILKVVFISFKWLIYNTMTNALTYYGKKALRQWSLKSKKVQIFFQFFSNNFGRGVLIGSFPESEVGRTNYFYPPKTVLIKDLLTRQNLVLDSIGSGFTKFCYKNNKLFV